MPIGSALELHDGYASEAARLKRIDSFISEFALMLFLVLCFGLTWIEHALAVHGMYSSALVQWALVLFAEHTSMWVGPSP